MTCPNERDRALREAEAALRSAAEDCLVRGREPDAATDVAREDSSRSRRASVLTLEQQDTLVALDRLTARELRPLPADQSERGWWQGSCAPGQQVTS